MRAVILQSDQVLSYEEVPIPAPAAGEALIRVLRVGICSSDVPRAFRGQAYRYPLIMGHEIAGVVDKAPDAPELVGRLVAVIPLIPCRRCDRCRAGDFALCTAYDYIGSRRDGGFAEYVTAPVENLVPVPDGVDADSACQVELAAVALNAVRRADVKPGDRVAIIGAGPLGWLAAQWATLRGAAPVVLIDVSEEALHRARAALGHRVRGLQLVLDRGNVAATFATETGGNHADVVVQCAGAPAAFISSLTIAGMRGRVVWVGNPDADLALPRSLVSQILRRELDIRGTWNSSFLHPDRPDWRVVLGMTATDQLDVRCTISHHFPLSGAVEGFRVLRERSGYVGKVVLSVTDAAS